FKLAALHGKPFYQSCLPIPLKENKGSFNSIYDDPTRGTVWHDAGRLRAQRSLARCHVPTRATPGQPHPDHENVARQLPAAHCARAAEDASPAWSQVERQWNVDTNSRHRGRLALEMQVVLLPGSAADARSP